MGDQTGSPPRRGFPAAPIAPAAPTRFLYRAMSINEFYVLARRQGLAFGYVGCPCRVTEIWLTESLERHATSYIVSRQGRELSTLARLEVSNTAYKKIRSAFFYQHARGRPANSNIFNLERILNRTEIHNRFGNPPAHVPTRQFAEINPCIKNMETLEQVNQAIQEIRTQGVNGEAFNCIVTPDGIRNPGKVKLFMAKNGAVVVAAVIDIVLLTIAIHQSITTRQARPAVETATTITTSSLAAYAMSIVLDSASAAATAASVGVGLIVAGLVNVVFELLWKPETPPVFASVRLGPGPPCLSVDLSAAVNMPSLENASVSTDMSTFTAVSKLLRDMPEMPDVDECLQLVQGAPAFQNVGQSIEAELNFVEDNASLQVSEVVALLQNTNSDDVIVVSSSDTTSSFEFLHEFNDGEDGLSLSISRSIQEEDTA